MAQIVFSFAYNTETTEMLCVGNISTAEALRMLADYISKKAEQKEKDGPKEEDTV
jgi:hypothetical protein